MSDASPETQTCDKCAEAVESGERVLVLMGDGETWRHPACHANAQP